MDLQKKYLILGLTLLTFCELSATMGFCRFARMFPNQGKTSCSKDDTSKEDKAEEKPATSEGPTTLEALAVTTTTTDPVCSRNALPAVKNGSFECNSNNDKMSSLRIGDVCSMKCDKGFYRTLSNHTICERGSHDQEGHWSDGIFECHVCIKWTEWNGSMYRFINTTQNLEKSEMICQNQSYYDAHLVYIGHEDENEFITNMILQCGSSWPAWIGLSDKDEEGAWNWGQQNAEYLNWGMFNGRDEPNGGRMENYAITNYFGTGKWHDVGPDRMSQAVCEKEL